MFVELKNFIVFYVKRLSFGKISLMNFNKRFSFLKIIIIKLDNRLNDLLKNFMKQWISGKMKSFVKLKRKRIIYLIILSSSYYLFKIM